MGGEAPDAAQVSGSTAAIHASAAAAAQPRGGTIAARPLVRVQLSASPVVLLVCCLAAFMGGLFGMGAMGEASFLMNSLDSPAAWRPPAVFVYVAGFVLVGGAVGWSVYLTSLSRYDLVVTLVTLLALSAMYAGPFALALLMGVPLAVMTYHPHHWSLAFNACLLLRAQDPLVTVFRWVLTGVLVHGIAGYGPASLLSS